MTFHDIQSVYRFVANHMHGGNRSFYTTQNQINIAPSLHELSDNIFEISSGNDFKRAMWQAL